MGQPLTSPHREVSPIPISLAVWWAVQEGLAIARLLELLLSFLQESVHVPVQSWFPGCG